MKLLALQLGMLLVYAGAKGLSVGKLLRGDNQTPAANKSLAAGDTLSGSPSTPGAGASVPPSGYAQGSGSSLH